MILACLRRFAACLALLASTAPAFATSTGIDYTDQWWGGQAESGWGVNFIEQGTTIFATLFVYGADQKPTWFVASMTTTTGPTAFTGILYATTGPAYTAAQFDTHSVTATGVGTMTVNFVNAYSGTMNYVVNGVSVNKNIVRQTFAGNNLGGAYMGGLAATASNCNGGGANGVFAMNGGIVVTQAGQNVSMAVTFYNTVNVATTCTFTGVLGAQGVLGQIANGAFTCTGSTVNGAYNLDNMTMTQNGFSGIFAGHDSSCTYNGWFGGVRVPM